MGLRVASEWSKSPLSRVSQERGKEKKPRGWLGKEGRVRGGSNSCASPFPLPSMDSTTPAVCTNYAPLIVRSKLKLQLETLELFEFLECLNFLIPYRNAIFDDF